jgi:hypothetical protein
MKVLIGAPDTEPRGISRTGTHEVVGFARLAEDRHGGDVGFFVGTQPQLGFGIATLARVVETPTCFNLRAELRDDPYVTRAVALVRDMEVGTLVRPRLSAAGKRIPNGIIIPAHEWELVVVGPN